MTMERNCKWLSLTSIKIWSHPASQKHFRIDCESELQVLHKAHRQFTISCFSLDWNIDLEIIKGNEYQKPLKYFMNVGDDVMSQTKLILLNLRTAFDAIQMNNCTTFENYKKAFVIADDFLNLLNEFLVFCNIYLKYS